MENLKEVIQLFNEKRTIPSKNLQEIEGIGKILAKLVEMDLIVLDNLKPSIWKLK